MNETKYRADLIAEYGELSLKIGRLEKIVYKPDSWPGPDERRPSRLEFPMQLREMQLEAMRQYLNVLRIRLEMIGCNLDEIDRIIWQNDENRHRMTAIMNGEMER